jgi:hypothetical protein
MKHPVKARIVVTVEVDGATYGEDWTLEDINKQAGKEAITMLTNSLRDKGIAIIGDPKVKTITIFEP